MSTSAVSPFRALIQCAVGAAGVIGVIALLWVGVPWTTVGGFLGRIFSVIGHALGVVFIPVAHAIKWCLDRFADLFGFLFSWAAFHPVSFFVILGGSLLTSVCLIVKLDGDTPLSVSDTVRSRWIVRASTFTGLAIVYAVISLGAWAISSEDQSRGNYDGTNFTLHAQLKEMDWGDRHPNFADQVAAANKSLGDYGYKDTDGKWVKDGVTPVVLVDAKARIAEFTDVSLNRRSCLDLGQSDVKFVARTINGKTIRTPADVADACTHLFFNEAVIRNKPERWPAPDPNKAKDDKSFEFPDHFTMTIQS